MYSSAADAPLLILNSFGFSGAETLATFLSSHSRIGLLPGQNFIQQEHTLYRPLSFPKNDVEACFEILATRQYTKAGAQWAGLGKFMSTEYAAQYSLSRHRTLFKKCYADLSCEDQTSFTELTKLYTQSFFDCIGTDRSDLAYFGLYGSNLIINAFAYPNFHNGTRILQVKPSPENWLALASQARTWNPDQALMFYIIQNLIITQHERTHDNTFSISYESLITDTQNALNRCCAFLDIEPWSPDSMVDGQGHAPATETFFEKILEDSAAIKTIYSGSMWFDTAQCLSDWCDPFLADPVAVELLEQYKRYWNSTSHIAFDWTGPLETQLQNRVKLHAQAGDIANGEALPSTAYLFYQQWFHLSSTNHTDVTGRTCYPLGMLESDFPLPKLQYFLRIAIHYIHASVTLQAEKLHSYHDVRHGHLYQQLCLPEYQQLLDRYWLRDAFTQMEQAIENTERLFGELQSTSQAHAHNSNSNSNSKWPTISTTVISQDQIAAIAVAGPDITEHEKSYVASAMDDWYENPYYYCESFEARFAEYHNRQFALMTPSCTTANHLLLEGLGIGPGDEVLVPECTWIASATPTFQTGATPVFCDVNTDDWCISLESMQANLTTNTRAIVVVNPYGNMAKMDEIIQFAQEHNLYLIEDAAESIGSIFKGKKSGEFGIGSVFSFHRTKTLTTGEGGMLLIDDEDLYNRCVKLRDHGRGPETPAFTHDLVAYKYMPFNVQAALGLAQLERIDQLVDKKRHILHYYKERLSTCSDIQFNLESEDVYNSAWCSTVVLGNEHYIDKPALIAALQSHGIPSRPFFYPLSSQPGIRDRLGNNVEHRLKNPNAYRISNKGINLPSALNLTDMQLDYICSKLEMILQADSGDATKAA